MSVRAVRANASSDDIRGELIYTESILEANEATADLAPPFAELRQRGDALQVEARELANAVVRARARAEAVHVQLDLNNRAIADRLAIVVNRNYADPRWRNYFPDGSSRLIRLSMDTQLGRVRGWSAMLAGEGDATLAQLGTQLTALIEAGTSALEARITAEQAEATWTIRSWNPFIEDINETRLTTFGELTIRAAQSGYPSDWPRSFFLR